MERAIGSLSEAQLWATPGGMTSAGFHAKHLAGSTDRLCTYLAGAQLNSAQLVRMEAEKASGEAAAETAAELMDSIREALARYETLLRDLAPEEFGVIREVGGHRLPVTAIGLAIHIAEHAQRHTGQAISAGKLANSHG